MDCSLQKQSLSALKHISIWGAENIFWKTFPDRNNFIGEKLFLMSLFDLPDAQQKNGWYFWTMWFCPMGFRAHPMATFKSPYFKYQRPTRLDGAEVLHHLGHLPFPRIHHQGQTVADKWDSFFGFPLVSLTCKYISSRSETIYKKIENFWTKIVEGFVTKMLSFVQSTLKYIV